MELILDTPKNRKKPPYLCFMFYFTRLLFIVLTFALTYSDSSGQSEKLLPFMQGHLWGYADREGKTAIRPQFHDASFFQEGFGRIRLNGLYGFIDDKGNTAIQALYMAATDFSEGFSLVLDTLNQQYFIDKQGNKAIELPEGIVQAEPFHDGLAKVSKQLLIKRKGVDEMTLLTGFMNSRGEILINAEYDDASDFEKGLATVVKKGKMGLIDKQGKIVVAISYDYIGSFSEGLAIFRQKGKYGYIDMAGKKVIKARFDNVGDFGNGLAPVMMNRLWGYVDTKGALVIKPQYLWAENFCEGMAGVVMNKKWGFINKAGELKIRTIYEDYAPFCEGLAAVKFKGIWGYTDSNGTFAVMPTYDIAGSFRDGVTMVETNKEAMYITPSGHRIISYSIEQQKLMERKRETYWNKAEMRYEQEYADWKKQQKKKK